jgi:lipopolysaccharide export system protein LptC
MSSHTEPSSRFSSRRVHRAVAWSRLSPWLAAAAALAAIAIATVFMLQAGLLDVLMPPEPVTPPDIESPTDTTTYELKLTGYDKENKPYSILAKKGRQDPVNKDIMYLDDMIVEFSNAAGSKYNIVAKSTVYNKKDETMDMKGDVVVRQGNRFTARMPQALAHIKTKSLSTHEDVAVTFADGTITAKGMEILDDGNRTRFLDNVKSRFGYPTQDGGNPQ